MNSQRYRRTLHKVLCANRARQNLKIVVREAEPEREQWFDGEEIPSPVTD